jgi:hypothetical protein
MANDMSHLWCLTDSQLLAHFNLVYLQPLPWHFCHLWPMMKSTLISACSGQPLMPVLFLHAPKPTTRHGSTGVPSANPLEPTKPSPKFPTLFSSSKSLLNGTMMAMPAPAINQFALAQWRMPSMW